MPFREVLTLSVNTGSIDIKIRLYIAYEAQID